MSHLKRIAFTIEGEAVAKQRPRHNRFTNTTYTPQKTKNYEELVAMSYRIHARGYRFEDNVPIGMLVVVHKKPPASSSKKNREAMLNGSTFPTVKADWDNLGKAISDALNGIAYGDDKQIVDARVVKEYAEREYVKVVLWEVEPRQGENEDGIREYAEV